MTESTTQSTDTNEGLALPAVVDQPTSLAIRPSSLRQRLARYSRDEAEARYVAARDAWSAAMKAAASGTEADLEWLAVAQEAFEEASAERMRWLPANHGAAGARADLDVAVTQELAWRDVRSGEPPTDRSARRKGWRPGR